MYYFAKPLSAIVFAAFLFFSFIGYGSAESQWSWHHETFTNFGHQQGLPFGKITAIEEDALGFSWFLTQNGMYRYDGSSFTAVPVKVNGKTVSVHSISTYIQRQFLLVTSSGLVQFNPLSREAHSLHLPNALTSISYAIYSPSLHSVWFTHSNGISRLDTDTSALETFSLVNPNKTAELRIFDMVVDEENRTWVASSDGLNVKAHDANDFKPVDLSHHLPHSQRISTLGLVSNGELWFGTPRDGLFHIASDGRVAKVSLPLFKGEWIFDIAQVSETQIWIGTFGQGILSYSLNSGEVKRITHNRLYAESVINDEIWQIYVSPKGYLWIATSNGASLFNPQQESIKSIYGDIGAVNGISDQHVKAIATETNKVWLGLAKNGVDIAHPDRGINEHIPVQSVENPNALPVGAIEAIAITPHRGALIGSNWGIYQYHEGELSKLSLQVRDSNAYTGTLLVVDQKTFFAGGTDGLWKFTRSKTGELSNENHIADTLTDRRISALARLRNGNLVVGTWNGLNWIDIQGGLIRQLTHVETKNKEVRVGFISDLLVDGNNQLWVATEGEGLIGIDLANPSAPAVHFNHLNGLTDNVVRSLQADSYGRIWVGSRDGISVIEAGQSHARAIQGKDKRLFAPYYRGASAIRDDGMLLMGGSGGVTLIDTHKFDETDTIHPVVFASTQVGERVLSHPLLGQSESTPIHVPANDNKLRIHFTNLDYFHAATSQYRYMLKGLENDWNYSEQHNRIASYTQIPPGDYQFIVQNRPTLWSQWSPSTASNVVVSPYWYQTLWAKLVYVVLALSAIALLIALRTRRLKQREAYLLEQVRLRTESLEATSEKLKEKSDALLKASHTDPLTQVYNRRFTESAMEKDGNKAIADYEKSHSATAIEGSDILFFLIDIDHFKKVNDVYGHHVGDQILIEVAKRLSDVAREDDYVVRWGGEEFLLVVRHSSRERSATMAASIQNSISSVPVPIENGDPIHVTCTLGSVPFPLCPAFPNQWSWLETITLADKALYTGKAVGRDVWVDVSVANTYKPPIPSSCELPPLSALSLSSNANGTVLRQVWLVTHNDLD